MWHHNSFSTSGFLSLILMNFNKGIYFFSARYRILEIIRHNLFKHPEAKQAPLTLSLSLML